MTNTALLIDVIYIFFILIQCDAIFNLE